MPGGKNPPLSVIKSWPKPNYVNPETTGPASEIVSVFLSVLVTLVLVARLWARFIVIRQPGHDDYIITLGTIVSFGTVAVLFRKNEYGGDKHIWDVKPGSGVMLNQLTYFGALSIVFSMGCVKASMLLFYNRVLARTAGKLFRWINYGTLAFVVLSSVAFFIVVIFQCNPIEAYWLQYRRDPPYTTPKRCVHEGAYMTAYSACNLLLDFWITALPLFFLRRLQMPARQKWALTALFGVGFFICVTGCVRMVYIVKIYFQSYDTTWYANKSWLWAVIETHVSILCASAPALKPFFTEYFSSPTSGLWRRKSSNYHQQGGSSEGITGDSKEAWSVDKDFEMQRGAAETPRDTSIRKELSFMVSYPK